MRRPAPSTISRPHVVIVGGGFGGLIAALALRDAPVRVTLVDRSNHHLFQPLLYQVATAALSPAQIAAPIRHILAGQGNCTVWMAEVVRVDAANRRVVLTDGELSYDVLILAAGATHSYFGHDEWAPFAPGLKTIADAEAIRQELLLAFERAERLSDSAAQRRQLTFVIVGGGPTGVEMAGAISEIAFETARRDFKHIDTANARVILVEALDRLLASYPEKLSRRAHQDLTELGIEVRLKSLVTRIDDHSVTVTTADGSEEIQSSHVLWAAGVQANPLGKSLGVPLDRHERVYVAPDLSVPGHPEIFVIGDLAHVKDIVTGDPVPAVAPAALQMGRHVAAIIAGEAGTVPKDTGSRPTFRYQDRGLLATIGRKRAVAALGPFRFAGFSAWLVWCVVHILFLITFRQRILVMVEWIWSYLTFTGGARLITGDISSEEDPPSTV
jgi:NADH:ubiquinone reductase (H+-translocating)